jgi:putative glutamine amidotransferase
MFHPDPARPIFKGKRLLYMEESMFHWLIAAGCVPSLIPTVPAHAPQGARLADLAAAFDGIMISGGVDMAPESYGESPLKPEWSGDAIRDAYEMDIIRAAMALDRPVFGVCRGLQVINVALGGSLYQDITTQHQGALVHRDWDSYDANHHDVVLELGGALAAMYDLPAGRQVRINSVHHQGIKQLGKGLVVEARSPKDGIIEAVRLRAESAASPYVMAVQWHPEFQRPSETDLLPTAPLAADFLAAVRRRRDLRLRT